MLVANEQNPAAAVRGVFTFQRKGRNDELADNPELRDAVFSDQEFGAIAAFASWVAARPSEAAVALQALQSQDLAAFDAATGIARLQKFISEWQGTERTPARNFGQSLLARESWVIGQLFGAPFVIVKGKAYVGGKTRTRTPRRVSRISSTEIGLPAMFLSRRSRRHVTSLLGGQYWQGVYPPSVNLSGAVSQVLDQRQTLVANYQETKHERAGAMPFHSRTLVLAGDLARLGGDEPKLKSFELYRNELRGVEIVTFDELAANAEELLELFRVAS